MNICLEFSKNRCRCNPKSVNIRVYARVPPLGRYSNPRNLMHYAAGLRMNIRERQMTMSIESFAPLKRCTLMLRVRNTQSVMPIWGKPRPFLTNTP